MKYWSRYEFSNNFDNPHHTWIVIARHLAVSLNISVFKDNPSGGIEYHYREPPEHMKDDAPSHNPCSILGAPCWHDGSSMQATEIWIPRWQESPHDHVRMLTFLEAAIEDRAMTTTEMLSKVTGVT